MPQGDIKSTYVDVSCCITAVSRFKLARFDSADSNVSKTSFRDWAYNCPRVSFQQYCFLRLLTHEQTRLHAITA